MRGAAMRVAKKRAGLEGVSRFHPRPRLHCAASGEQNAVGAVVHQLHAVGGDLHGLAVPVGKEDCAGSRRPKTFRQDGGGFLAGERGVFKLCENEFENAVRSVLEKPVGKPRNKMIAANAFRLILNSIVASFAELTGG